VQYNCYLRRAATVFRKLPALLPTAFVSCTCQYIWAIFSHNKITSTITPIMSPVSLPLITAFFNSYISRIFLHLFLRNNSVSSGVIFRKCSWTGSLTTSLGLLKSNFSTDRHYRIYFAVCSMYIYEKQNTVQYSFHYCYIQSPISAHVS
jgi:hypothetical protein